MSRNKRRGKVKNEVKKTDEKIEDLYDDVQLPYSEDMPEKTETVIAAQERIEELQAKIDAAPEPVKEAEPEEEAPPGEEEKKEETEPEPDEEAPPEEEEIKEETESEPEEEAPPEEEEKKKEAEPEPEEETLPEEEEKKEEAESEPEEEEPPGEEEIKEEAEPEPDEEAPPEEEPPLEDIQPEETAEEENLPLPPEPVRQKRERRRRKPLFKKISILVIPENAVNVKSYKISILPLVLCVLFIFALIALAVFSAIYGIRNVRDLRKQVIALNANLINITNANVLLEADKEELENQLREANARLSTTTYLQEQTASAQAMDHIPSGFPLDGQASVPSQYSEEHQYITFPTGMGAKIVATGAGTVVSIIDDNNLGHVLQIDHGNGYISVYYSHSDPLVKEGDSVIRGTTLYIVQGDTETLTYQILYNEKYIDPATIMRIDG